MTPSSLGYNSSNSPPKRISVRRHENNSPDIYHNEKISSEKCLEIEKTQLLWHSIVVDEETYYAFKLNKENTLQCIERLKSKVEKCLPLLKDFIICAINGSKTPIKSSLELILETSSIIDDQKQFPLIFLSLFTSNIAKKLIKNTQRIRTNSARMLAAERLQSLFTLLITSISEITSYILKFFQLDELQNRNVSIRSLENSFSDTISSIFPFNKVIMNIEIKELAIIIISSVNIKNDEIAINAQHLILIEALDGVKCAMRSFTNQSYFNFINTDTIPVSSEELLFAAKNILGDIFPICSTKNLMFWEECIFCTIAHIFLKEKFTVNTAATNLELLSHLRPYFPDVFIKNTNRKIYQKILIKEIICKLINSDKTVSENNLRLLPIASHNVELLLEISCKKLEICFIHLNKLLEILSNKISRDLNQNKKKCKNIKLDIISNLNEEMKEIAITAINIFNFSDTENSLVSISQSCSSQTYTETVPTRKSKKRSQKPTESIPKKRKKFSNERIFCSSKENRANLKLKVESFANLLKRFIFCSINGTIEHVTSPIELLLSVESVLFDKQFPFIFLPLFTSDFAKSIIKEKQATQKKCIREQAIAELKCIFPLLIASLSEVTSYIKKVAKNEEIRSPTENYFSNIIFSAFQLHRSEMSVHIKELTLISISSINSKNDKTFNVAQNALLTDAFHNLKSSMQFFIDCAFAYLINFINTVPSSIENLFVVLKKTIPEDISTIECTKNLNFWKECIFCTIARIFLRKKNQIPDNLTSTDLVKNLRSYFNLSFKKNSGNSKHKILLIKKISNILTSSDEKHDDHTAAQESNYLPALKSSIKNLNGEFLNLKKLLEIFLQKIYRDSFFDENFKICPDSDLQRTLSKLKKINKEFFRHALSALYSIETEDSLCEKYKNKISHVETSTSNPSTRISKKRFQKLIESMSKKQLLLDSNIQITQEKTSKDEKIFCYTITNTKILKCKAKKSLQLVKKFISCAINGSIAPSKSTIEILCSTASILGNEQFSFILISLFTSDIFKKLTKEVKIISTKNSRLKASKEVKLMFPLLIASISEVYSYVKHAIDKKFPEKPMDTICFYKKFQSVFRINRIKMNPNIKELILIIVHTAGKTYNYSISNAAKRSLLVEAVDVIFDFMQRFINQALAYLINTKNIIPLSTEKLFFLVAKIINADIRILHTIKNLKFWKECIFCALAHIFLRGKSILINYSNNKDLVKNLRPYFVCASKRNLHNYNYKNLLIKNISNILITSGNKYDDNTLLGFSISHQSNYLSMLKKSFQDLNIAIINLKKILEISLLKTQIDPDINENSKLHMQNELAHIFPKLKIYYKDIFNCIITDFNSIKTEYPLCKRNKNKISYSEIQTSKVPIRRSKKRLRKPLMSQSSDKPIVMPIDGSSYSKESLLSIDKITQITLENTSKTAMDLNETILFNKKKWINKWKNEQEINTHSSSLLKITTSQKSKKRKASIPKEIKSSKETIKQRDPNVFYNSEYSEGHESS